MGLCPKCPGLNSKYSGINPSIIVEHLLSEAHALRQEFGSKKESRRERECPFKNEKEHAMTGSHIP